LFNVKTEGNPADLASRGISVHELKNSNLWWQGPEWLLHNQEQWPLNSSVQLKTKLEQRPIKCNIVIAPPKSGILERFSAFVLRASTALRKREQVSSTISNLSPFVDGRGFLKASGRL